MACKCLRWARRLDEPLVGGHNRRCSTASTAEVLAVELQALVGALRRVEVVAQDLGMDALVDACDRMRVEAWDQMAFIEKTKGWSDIG